MLTREKNIISFFIHSYTIWKSTLFCQPWPKGLVPSLPWLTSPLPSCWAIKHTLENPTYCYNSSVRDNTEKSRKVTTGTLKLFWKNKNPQCIMRLTTISRGDVVRHVFHLCGVYYEVEDYFCCLGTEQVLICSGWIAF